MFAPVGCLTSQLIPIHILTAKNLTTTEAAGNRADLGLGRTVCRAILPPCSPRVCRAVFAKHSSAAEQLRRSWLLLSAPPATRAGPLRSSACAPRTAQPAQVPAQAQGGHRQPRPASAAPGAARAGPSGGGNPSGGGTTGGERDRYLSAPGASHRCRCTAPARAPAPSSLPTRSTWLLLSLRGRSAHPQ